MGELYESSSGLSKSAEHFGFGYPFLSFKTVFNNPVVPLELPDLVSTTEVEQSRFSIKKGDVFVTSGAGGYYAPGIAVAIVTQVNDDGGVARIISDPAATDFVAVEQIFEPEAVVGAATPIEKELTD